MTVPIVSSTHHIVQNVVILSESTEQQTPICYRDFFLFSPYDAFGMGSEAIACWPHDRDLILSINTTFGLSTTSETVRAQPVNLADVYVPMIGLTGHLHLCWPITAKQ
jgi:hypothetical protein